MCPYFFAVILYAIRLITYFIELAMRFLIWKVCEQLHKLSMVIFPRVTQSGAPYFPYFTLINMLYLKDFIAPF